MFTAMLPDADTCHDRASDTATWEDVDAARRQVTAIVGDLPTGFSVFHDLELPRPSVAVVEHLVISPKAVWAITTVVSEEAITVGSGRNTDTLFAGRASLRPDLDAADLHAAALSEILGVHVTALIVGVAPSIPATSDHLGVSVVDPTRLADHLTDAGTQYIDASTVHDRVAQVFGRSPDHAGPVPVLAAPVVSPVLRPTAAPVKRRTIGARVHAVKQRSTVRLGMLAAIAAVVVISLPVLLAVWNSVSETGSDLVVEALDQVPGTNSAVTTPAPTALHSEPPAAVGTTISCSDGLATVTWQWPGAPAEGATGYAIRLRRADGPTTAHTLTPWSTADERPVPMRMAAGETVVVLTDHVTDSGTLVTTSRSTVQAPTAGC